MTHTQAVTIDINITQSLFQHATSLENMECTEFVVPAPLQKATYYGFPGHKLDTSD
jgi:uncharacterized protein (DUF1778 family)